MESSKAFFPSYSLLVILLVTYKSHFQADEAALANSFIIFPNIMFLCSAE